MTYVIAYIATGLVFAIIDACWLTLAGPRLYQPILEPILADKPNLAAAAVFYVIYIAGVLRLAVLPTRDEPWTRPALTGAVLGAVAYATYDLTNQATLKLWSTRLTVIDIG